MKHIYLDKSFLFFLLIVILSGSFNNFILYFVLLIIHELGHMITGIFLGYDFLKISFYPSGGETSFKLTLNKSLWKEMLVLVMGPIMQIVGYLILSKFINNSNLTIYNYALLIFNLLPIYPLDGGKLLNIIFNYKYNYLLSNKITFIISFISIIIIFVYNSISFNLSLFIMIIVLIYKLISNYQKRDYYYNYFLLERLLYEKKYHKKEYINSIRKMYRDREHIINLEKEQKVLKKYFKCQNIDNN